MLDQFDRFCIKVFGSSFDAVLQEMLQDVRHLLPGGELAHGEILPDLLQLIRADHDNFA